MSFSPSSLRAVSASPISVSRSSSASLSSIAAIAVLVSSSSWVSSPWVVSMVCLSWAIAWVTVSTSVESSVLPSLTCSMRDWARSLSPSQAVSTAWRMRESSVFTSVSLVWVVSEVSDRVESLLAVSVARVCKSLMGGFLSDDEWLNVRGITGPKVAARPTQGYLLGRNAPLTVSRELFDR